MFEVTQSELDKYFFKVPGLRNIEHIEPYFHDGSVEELDKAVKIMGKLQRNLELTDEQVNDIVIFLKSLSADIPEEVKQNPFAN